uniref:Uncharacterized protein n=1 Tax=Rhipicephalus microplus TaxID=6941 RepID=A0A6M2CMC5_RHIMP
MTILSVKGFNENRLPWMCGNLLVSSLARFVICILAQIHLRELSSAMKVQYFTEDPVFAKNVCLPLTHSSIGTPGCLAWRFSKVHRAQFIQAFRRLTDEECVEVFPSHRERWRVRTVVGALEAYPTQTIRGMARLIGMSKTRVYETLRDAFSKLENYCLN